MKKYQKTTIALLSALSMIVPFQAAFADQALTPTTPVSQDILMQRQVKDGISIFASNPYPGYFDNGVYTPYIYMTGRIEITFQANVLGTYYFQLRNENGTLYPVRHEATQYGSQKVIIEGAYGYQQIYANSPNGLGGGYFNIHY
ncbi:hypothetical protein ACQKFM_08875 [Paenibacillus xylanexedens]|uniref:hypothetical protein n=1 Tax=Paenibacillus xylanexedens TaxID=528191 RepID=UPI003CFE8920